VAVARPGHRVHRVAPTHDAGLTQALWLRVHRELPFFGRTVIISDSALVKQFFQTRTDVVRNVEPNLDLVLGPGSTFGLQDEAHRRRRKLLVPPFHGKRMRAYENLVEEETLKETDTWPEGREFAVLPSTNRITLNVILRAVFGAEGAEFDALRKVMPPLVALGSQLVFLPWLHRDLGPWSRGVDSLACEGNSTTSSGR
jgi:cytochrome P450 family 138